MSLDNIDDLFSEQPLKIEKTDTTIDDEAISSLKKDIVKNQFEKAVSSQRFSIRKILYTISKIETRQYLNLLKIAVITLAFVFSYFMIMQAVNNIRGFKAGNIIIEQPEMFNNNSNFIYIDKDFVIDGKTNNLLKIKIDTLATEFYFQGYIDRDVFTPVLIDEKGRRYLHDNDYIKNANVKEDVIVFTGLNTDIENFRLVFTKDINDLYERLDSVYFDFSMESEILNTPVKHYMEDFELIKNNNNRSFSMQIQNATFSSAVSDLVFSVYHDEGIEYDFSPEVLEKTVYIRDGHKNISFRDNNLKLTDVNVEGLNSKYNTIKLGKVSFGILQNLNTDLTIGIQEFYRVFRPKSNLDVRALVLREGNQIYELDEYTVYFEGARKYDSENLFVLTGYGEENFENLSIDNQNSDEDLEENTEELVETTQSTTNNGLTSEKVEIIVDATLKLNLPDGSVEYIQGEALHKLEGTDILFRSENIPLVKSSDMELTVNKITVIEDGGERVVSLKEADDTINPELKQYLDFADKAVRDRLKYKASEMVYLQLEDSYAFNLISNEEFIELYEPIEFETRPNITVNILSYAFDNEGNFIVIVEEELVGKNEGWKVNFRNKHELVIKEVYGKMKVVRDRIIE